MSWSQNGNCKAGNVNKVVKSCNIPPLHEHFGIDAIWGDIKSPKDNTIYAGKKFGPPAKKYLAHSILWAKYCL